MLQTYSNLERDRANFRQNRKSRRADKKNKRAENALQHTLPEFKDSPLAFIKEGRVTITGEQAALILEECSYAEQTRHLSLNGRKHIDVLAMKMERRQWRRADSINFALLDGIFILLDGHHRLAANAKFGGSIEWMFIVHPVETTKEVEDLYGTFNRHVRGRVESDILLARRIPQKFGISLRTSRAAFRAAPLLASEFDFVASFFDTSFTKDDELRIDTMEDFKDEIIVWEKITAQRGINGEHKRRMGNQGALSVALVTLACCPDMAYEFWNNVAKTSGGENSPSHTYALALQRGKEGGGATTSGQARETARQAAHAWNRHVKGGTGKSFADRKKDEDLKIEGTPYFVPAAVPAR